MDKGSHYRAIVNITFHGVGLPERTIAREEEAVWLSFSDFESILDTAREQANIRITFDDGNRSDVEVALPSLLKRGMKAAFFVLAGRLDMPGSLTRGDLKTLKDAGMRVGLRGMHHRAWRDLSGRELDEELVDSRASLRVPWDSTPGDTSVYLQGATSEEGLKAKATYALQWSAVATSRARGCRGYDLGGIDPERNPTVYHFKAGMGGVDSRSPGTFEISSGSMRLRVTLVAERAACWAGPERLKIARVMDGSK